jgi:Outer membrane protein beta-barrel family
MYISFAPCNKHVRLFVTNINFRMKTPFILIFSLLVSFGFSAVRSNDYKISGTLQDENHENIPYATVLLVNHSDSSLVKGGLTDSLGNFEIQFADTGKFMLTVEIFGFTKYFSEPLDINSTNKWVETGKIKLIRNKEGTLDEVTVVTQKKFIDMQAGKLIITPDNSPISTGSTAYEVLKRAPGVSIDQNSNLTLKGKTNIMIFIDDKPTYMTQDQLMNYLKDMPASQIAFIEIINNPGAKYDASGNAGVINIRTKKLKNKGYNGNVRLTGGYGWYYKSYAGAQLNYRNKFVNVFGAYSYNNRLSGDRNEFDRVIPSENGNTFFDQFFENTSKDIGNNYKIGSDFYLSKRTTLGILFKGAYNPSSEVLINTTEVKDYNPMGFSKLVAENNSSTPFSNYTANMNLVHEFDTLGQKKLNIDLDFSPFKASTDSRFYTRYYDASLIEILTPQDLRSSNFSNVTIYAGKADYSQPLGKTASLEAGLKSSFVSIENEIKFELMENGNIVYDSSRSNDFKYDENINAAYASYAAQLKKVSLTMGLRTEHTSNKGFSKTLDSTVTRQYVNLFPSLNFGWDIDSLNNLNLAYSRRIDRPSYKDLNPFMYFADQYSFNKGNPFLNPQFTHGISLTHTFMQFLFTTVGTDITKNYMSDIIEQDTATKISFMTKTNFKTFKNYYFNIGAGAPIKKFFFMINFSGYYNEFKALYNGYNIDNSQFTYNGYLSASYSFKHDFKLECSGWYNSKAVYGIFKMSPMYTMDAGLKKSFPKTGMELNLSVTDIFNTLRNNIVLNDNGMNATFRNKSETRVARLTFTWNFGKQDLKPRKRSTATEDEQGRVKNGGGIGK